MNYLSECCDALPMGELYDKSGICSSCKEHAIFKAWDVGIKMKNTNKDGLTKNEVKMVMKEVNKAHIEKAQFKAYKIIKDLGHWNMDSRSAIEASGLSQNIYLDIKRNFNELNKQYGGDDK
jgi:5-bromo-4-chloroindolyl phosphate hydrolysis protein|tara:strand:- start:3494 stop:3856 length:363 start_codon:yes stop_codon:yes gene_type:complete